MQVVHENILIFVLGFSSTSRTPALQIRWPTTPPFNLEWLLHFLFPLLKCKLQILPIANLIIAPGNLFYDFLQQIIARCLLQYFTCHFYRHLYNLTPGRAHCHGVTSILARNRPSCSGISRRCRRVPADSDSVSLILWIVVDGDYLSEELQYVEMNFFD